MGTFLRYLLFASIFRFALNVMTYQVELNKKQKIHINRLNNFSDATIYYRRYSGRFSDEHLRLSLNGDESATTLSLKVAE